VSENLDKARPGEEANRPDFRPDGQPRSAEPGRIPPSSFPLETEAVASPVAPVGPADKLVTAAADADTNSPENLGQTVPLAPEAGSPEVATTVDQTAVTTRRRKSFWREVLETVILTILIFFLVKSLIQNFRIQGSSMEPSFHTNQLLLVNKAAYFHFDSNAWLRLVPGVKAEGTNVVWIFGGPHRGDVVVFEPPDVPTEDYIKRVIGLPGDKVEIRDGTVYVNDKPLTENYIKEKPFNAYGPVVVPPNALFVLGDNRNASRDSRIFGFLPFDKIVGKAMFVYWPFGKDWGVVPEVKQE
jgi:signal peptidase I